MHAVKVHNLVTRIPCVQPLADMYEVVYTLQSGNSGDSPGCNCSDYSLLLVRFPFLTHVTTYLEAVIPPPSIEMIPTTSGRHLHSVVANLRTMLSWTAVASFIVALVSHSQQDNLSSLLKYNIVPHIHCKPAHTPPPSQNIQVPSSESSRDSIHYTTRSRATATQTCTGYTRSTVPSYVSVPITFQSTRPARWNRYTATKRTCGDLPGIRGSIV